MGYKTITQIILVIVAFVIILMYIKPTLIGIREIQDEIFQYSDATSKAGELNQQLEALLNKSNSFKKSDMLALEEYLPPTIDTMSIMADINTISKQSGVEIVSLAPGELAESTNESPNNRGVENSDPKSYIDFNVTINGTYESFKAMIKALEQNKYMLEIMELSFSEFTDEDGNSTEQEILSTVDYKLILRAYAYAIN